MWGKAAEIPRLKALRSTVLEAFGGSSILLDNVELGLVLYADERAGDLDNFITGICDGLMAAHTRTPIFDTDWEDIPANAHPRLPIAFEDDSVVKKITAERVDPGIGGFRYELSIIGTKVD
ncbi:hypothetical protein JW877_01075 [bacterium]|nr:hypothetical protein [bacterium]